jgi:hypothetical protein
MYRDLDCLGECLEGVRRRPCPESRDDMAALSTVLFSDERMLLHAIEQVGTEEATTYCCPRSPHEWLAHSRS